MSKIVLIGLLSLGLVGAAFGGIQGRVQIKGEFFCQQTPEKVEGITVVLKDEDTLGLDDTMAETKLDATGKFAFNATASDPAGKIDPVLYVYHDCNDVGFNGLVQDLPAQRKWEFTIPDIYVKNAIEMDIGRINLELKIEKEGRHTDIFGGKK